MGKHNRLKNERIWQERPEGYLPDFLKLAEAHGACASRVTRPQDVVPALQEAFASPRPWVVECIVAPEANVLPMVPPGASLSEMICKLA